MDNETQGKQRNIVNSVGQNRGPNVDSDQQNMFSLSIMRMEKCTGENKNRVITTVRNPNKP